VVTLSLDWTGGLAFRNSASSPAIDLQSSNPAVASPPQALAYAVMGCMGMDVVHVLEKARHAITRFTIRFEGERAVEHPRRFVTMRLHFDISTAAPLETVERATELSRTRYCSVWHTIRPDVELETSCSVHS
jgi:putative redox protein